MGWQRVGHDWVTHTHTHTGIYTEHSSIPTTANKKYTVEFTTAMENTGISLKGTRSLCRKILDSIENPINKQTKDSSKWRYIFCAWMKNLRL